MKKYLLAMALVASPICFAQSASFQHDTLQIPGVGYVDGLETAFYGDVMLVHEGSGLFRLVEAESRLLVIVDEISIVVAPEHAEAVVTVEGHKSVPCVALDWPSVAKDEIGFNIVIAETALEKDEVCIGVPDQITRAVSLDLKGFNAGTYPVSVNGITTEFELTVDIPTS